jgi:FkbM family methyltransferase
MAKIDWVLYRVLEKLKNKSGIDYKKSYSQCGEDMIMKHIFTALQIAAPTYLDVGAHHPSFLSNTKAFYDDGSVGVNVEPDPSLITAFQEKRPRDTNLNMGIGNQAGTLPFYVMSSRTLNTFSEEEAHTVARDGKIKIQQIIDVPVVPINEVLSTHFKQAPDFMSLDVEGLDLAILRSMDFTRYRPKVVCVETITFSENRQGKKIVEIAEVMQDNGYFAYADTNVNTLFVDRNVW